MDISKALTIQGWTNEAELTWLAERASEHRRIVEIGSWKGRSTVALAENTDGYVVAVDTFRGTKEDGHAKELEGRPEHWLFRQFSDNTRDCTNVITVPLPSLEAASQDAFRGHKFDMIFIDAAHDYESVRADIAAWRPLLEDGGLLCGHDYDAGRPGVVKAVREAFSVIRRGEGSIWVGIQ